MGSKSNSTHNKMKAVIILGALALVLVSGLEQNEEESQLSLSEGTLQREARDTQPGKRKKNNKPKRKRKNKNQKKKSKKSKSAAALCDDSTVNDTGADGCKTKFEAYITAFDDCVKTPTCDCFKALTPVESSCSFKDANDAAK